MLPPTVNLSCQTETGIPCQLPFEYNGNYYDTCINVDNGGVPWCYTDLEKKYWEICNNSTCPYGECYFLHTHFY